MRNKTRVSQHRVAPRKRRTERALKPPAALMHVGAGSDHTPKPAVTWIPSPNFASRNGSAIDTLILHNTDGTLASAIQRFQNPTAQVSAHYIVDRNGGITQMVSDSETAWHSGKKDMNQRSIGIEVVAWVSALGMTNEQEASLIALCKYALDSYSIALDRVFPHRDIKPTKCPGWVWPTDSDFTAWTTGKLGNSA